jgi:hypothetical protein
MPRDLEQKMKNKNNIQKKSNAGKWNTLLGLDSKMERLIAHRHHHKHNYTQRSTRNFVVPRQRMQVKQTNTFIATSSIIITKQPW